MVKFAARASNSPNHLGLCALQVVSHDRAFLDDVCTDSLHISGAALAVDEPAILLHPPLPLVGVAIAMERERQQNDSLVDG